MMNLEQYLWPATTIVIFMGMMVLNWRALSVAHDLAKLALQNQLGAPHPTPTVPAQKPAPIPPASPVQTPPAGTGVSPSNAVTPGLVAFIKKEEGFTAKAFWDFKQWTNGYGTKALSSTEVIDEATATARLMTEIHAADKLVTDKFPNLPLGQHQALLDLTYNAGSGWEEAALGHQVAAQKIDSIKADILQYNHAGGQVLPGLTARREAEVSWFDNPI